MPSALVLYHYFYPDDVVSSVHLSELAEELVRRGWDVTAKPCNRSCRDESRKHSRKENWRGVQIDRVWRPAFPQASTWGRFANAAWMIMRWTATVVTTAPDFVIVGTDPVLSVILATIWKTLRPRTRVAHWCFDLFPEAAIADGLLKQESGLVKMLKPALRSAYRSCDLLVDIGSCMRARLEAYRPSGQQVTLTPWALAEPERPLTVDDQERSAIFGDARLALLYSGNFGRAHASDLILQLARRLEPHGTRVAFSVRGNRVDALRSDAANIPNVVFRPFAAQANLEARLSAADIHVVSVRDGFTGTVVPSKFFGALAAGRPVLYSGSPDSCIANWIHEHQVGWVLTQSNLEAVAAELVDYSQNSGRLARLFDHCHNVYRRHFSKKMVADRWDAELRRLLEETDQARAVDSSGSLPVRPS